MSPKQAVREYFKERYDGISDFEYKGNGLFYIIYVDLLEFTLTDLRISVNFRYNRLFDPVRLEYADPNLFEQIEEITAYKHPLLTIKTHYTEGNHAHTICS